MCHQRFWRSPGALAPIKAPDRPTRSGALRPGTSISQYGITWTFRDTHLTGQFLNGDYWIVGPVEIIGISPNPTVLSNGGVMNGSMLNPTVSWSQGAGAVFGNTAGQLSCPGYFVR